jgi:hypothetical protein
MSSQDRTQLFGRELGNRVRDHFASIRSLRESGDDLTELQNKSIKLERIRLAYEAHSDAQKTKDDRERVGKRVHRRLDNNG